MIYHAELSCLSCGYDLGDIEGRRGARLDDLVFLPIHQGDRLIQDERGQLRCPRCGGRVLPHGMGPVNRPIEPGTTYEGDIYRDIRLRSVS